MSIFYNVQHMVNVGGRKLTLMRKATEEALIVAEGVHDYIKPRLPLELKLDDHRTMKVRDVNCDGITVKFYFSVFKDGNCIVNDRVWRIQNMPYLVPDDGGTVTVRFKARQNHIRSHHIEPDVFIEKRFREDPIEMLRLLARDTFR